MKEPTALSTLSTTDALIDALREQILAGEIAAGTPLPEAEIATRFGVARPTVRAAIQALVHEGLLQRERNRSACVPRLTPDDVRDLFVIRKAIELYAVATLAERGLRPLAAERELERHEAAGPDTPWSEVVAAVRGFHRGIVEAIESPRLTRLNRSLEAEVRLCIAQIRQEQGGAPAERATEHRQIFEAIVRGDAERARRLMEEHLDGAVRLTLGEALGARLVPR